MLFGRRVGFSGTPSDLLPLELGKCLYETGDDGRSASLRASSLRSARARPRARARAFTARALPPQAPS